MKCWPDGVLVDDNQDGPRLSWQAADGPFEAETCWLLDARRAWFACPADERRAEPGPSEQRWTLRQTWPVLGDDEVQAAVTAVALAAWHCGHRFCPACGSPTIVQAAGWAEQCPGCGAQHFPRVDPAVIVALIDDSGRLLLGGQSSWGKRRSVFAGFVTVGESLEQAVHREVMEEVGLDIDHLQYFGSQPWPFPRSLMVAFTAHVSRPDDLHIDGHEIVRADWFSRDEVRSAWADGAIDPPPPMSIARRLIDTWLAG